MSGPLGAGKSLLARAVLRTCLGAPELDVPSPSYTLANVYAHPLGEIWHVDLYRISDPEELLEIGLADAAQGAILLVEWPDRWPDPPENRLDIDISITSETARKITIAPHGAVSLIDLKTALETSQIETTAQ
jgi:tRNA threonylcarbamoyl adenosine modification protein YjeE